MSRDKTGEPVMSDADTRSAIWRAFVECFPQGLFLIERLNGMSEALHSVLARQGRKKFGLPTAEQEATLAGNDNLDHLVALTEKLLDANTWDELLAE